VSLSRDQYVAAMKETALRVGKSVVMDWLIARAPFLSWSFPNLVVGYLVGLVLEIAIKETEFGMFFVYIDVRTTRQGRAFEAAAARNKYVQEFGTAEDKQRAERDLIAAFRDFVRLTS
jgi:hypothetical protein